MHQCVSTARSAGDNNKRVDFSRPFFQPKLAINQPDDIYEQEANAVADKVMRMHDASINNDYFFKPAITPVQRKCAHCEEEEKKLRRKEATIEAPKQLSAISGQANSFSAKNFIQSKAALTQPYDVNKQFAMNSHFFQPPVVAINRKCALCEEEKKMQRKEAGINEGVAGRAENYISNLSGGKSLSNDEKNFFEPRMGYDFADVRIHDNSSANQSAKDVNALAYTYGNNIVFGQHQYQPNSTEGKRLLAHELTHVVQQNVNIHRKLIQRTVHGGSAPVPTNCHNWKIPLPPWIAGTIAHSQIAAFFAAMGATPRLIPRAIKFAPCSASPGPRPFGTPPGFADLWVRKPGSVDIAEIKSTATGDACAGAEAQHYVNRHNDWLSRSGTFPLALDDSLYSGQVGLPVPGALLNLLPITGTDLPLGPFTADPLKILHVEGDATGAVVYWCTGMGLVNPIWLLLLKALLDRLRQLMEDMKKEWRRLEPVLEEIASVALTILKWVVIILLAIALLALLVVIVICALAEVPTAGLATICEVPAIAAAAAAVVAIAGLLDVGVPAFVTTVLLFFGAKTAASSSTESGADYERDADRSASGATGGSADANMGDRLTQALQSISSSISVGRMSDVAAALASVPDRAGPVLSQSAAALDGMGDSNTAGFLRSGMRILHIA